MSAEILVDPLIYHGPGCCMKCGGPLVVADSEITVMELNQDGVPITENTSIRCTGACMHCGSKIPMIRWKGGYIPYSHSSLILKKMQLQDEIKHRVDNMKENSKNNNPLALEVE